LQVHKLQFAFLFSIEFNKLGDVNPA